MNLLGFLDGFGFSSGFPKKVIWGDIQDIAELFDLFDTKVLRPEFPKRVYLLIHTQLFRCFRLGHSQFLPGEEKSFTKIGSGMFWWPACGHGRILFNEWKLNRRKFK